MLHTTGSVSDKSKVCCMCHCHSLICRTFFCSKPVQMNDNTSQQYCRCVKMHEKVRDKGSKPLFYVRWEKFSLTINIK